MSSFQEQKERLLAEAAKLHARNELSKNIGPDFFEPGMMEYPEQSDAYFEESTGKIVLRFESKGTRYDGRTEQIEKVKVGDAVRITRDKENAYNPNNFRILTEKGKDVGNMPAEICNAIAPLYDEGTLVIESAVVSFVDPISKRSRHAKQAILFVEMRAKLTAPKDEAAELEEQAAASETEAPADEGTVSDCGAFHEVSDPYALQLDLKANSFFIGGYEIQSDIALDEILQQVFCENARQKQDSRDSDCLHVNLRHTASFAEEDWIVCLIFRDGKFKELRLEHAKLFQQRNLLKNTASNPRLRKKRSALYSSLKSRLDELTGSIGEQAADRGNQQYIFHFDGHRTMLVQDNTLPTIAINIEYFRLEEMGE